MKAKEIRRKALVKLEGNWVPMIGITILVSVMSAAFGYVYVLIAPLILPGAALFTLKMIRNEKPDIADLFGTYKNYLNALVVFVIETLIIAAGLLLFIVPGIIFAYMFSLTSFIIADDTEQNLPAFEILKESARLMKGYKWKLFCLHLSFIGWILLCIITFGIALLWVSPYMAAAHAVFYDEIKKADAQNSIGNSDTVFENSTF